MITLGINAAFHDCAAALVKDGIVLAAAEEERFTRVKHGKRPVPFTTWQLPFHAIDFCLSRAGLGLHEVDRIAYSFDPGLLLDDIAPEGKLVLPLEPSAARAGDHNGSPWDPLFLSYIINAPRQLADGAPHHLRARFKDAGLRHIISAWQFVEHHLAHEASAFLCSPWDEAAVLTMDGRGEKVSTSYGHFSDGKYRRLRQIELPHSLGLLYEEVTSYLGFLHSSDEYKVMALASYGKPTYVDPFRDILQSDGNGGYSLGSAQLVNRFGPPRERGGETTQVHLDIAHSLQFVMEETVFDMARWLHRETGSDYLCMAGGVALNCVLNGKLLRNGPFKDVWVQPAAGDAGTALGAALWTDFRARGDGKRRWLMQDALLGPDYSNAEIEAFLNRAGVRWRRLHDVADETAQLLADEKIIGWFQGRMEFGPRALGARSILASPCNADMQSRLNELKDREDFRPVAPMVIEERAPEWFDAGGRDTIRAPYMVFVFDVLAERAGRIPSVRHIDGTARVQTVSSLQTPLLHDLLRAFEERTGVPVLVNTSFNTRGLPVVCTPRDAVEAFWTSPLDALVMGNCLVEKA